MRRSSTCTTRWCDTVGAIGSNVSLRNQVDQAAYPQDVGRRGSAQYVAGEQIEAFRERATRIRRHPLFQNANYSFNFYVRPHPGGTGWAIAMPRANEDQQFQLASLIRPLLASDDMSRGRAPGCHAPVP